MAGREDAEVARKLAWPRRTGVAGVGDQLARATALLVQHDQNISPLKAQRGLLMFVNETIRVKGRLSADEVSERMARPRLLAPVKLASDMVLECHRRLLHCPGRHVLYHLHAVEGIMIAKGKLLTQQVVNACPVCRRNNQWLHPQALVPLPLDRYASGHPPFTTISVDFLEMVGRRWKKRDGSAMPGALFMIIVCVVTSVVHLELTKGEAVEDVVKAWTRFVSRQGVWLTQVIADGGCGLVRAAKDLGNWHHQWTCAIATTTP